MSPVNESKDPAAIASHPSADKSPSSKDLKLDKMVNAHDIGAILYAGARDLESDDLEGERQNVKKKLDRILMPMVSRIKLSLDYQRSGWFVTLRLI
jgi:hypothetical protein